MRAVNRFNVTHFCNPHVLRIPNWYGTCLVMKIFTIGLPAECGHMVEKANLKSSNSSVYSVFQETIVPKIYENIKLKVSGNESDKEQVLEFMKQIKHKKVVEALIMRPKER